MYGSCPALLGKVFPLGMVCPWRCMEQTFTPPSAFLTSPFLSVPSGRPFIRVDACHDPMTLSCGSSIMRLGQQISAQRSEPAFKLPSLPKANSFELHKPHIPRKSDPVIYDSSRSIRRSLITVLSSSFVSPLSEGSSDMPANTSLHHDRSLNPALSSFIPTSSSGRPCNGNGQNKGLSC